jgi:hypothetical protein
MGVKVKRSPHLSGQVGDWNILTMELTVFVVEMMHLLSTPSLQ